jgi:hypothetical protein
VYYFHINRSLGHKNGGFLSTLTPTFLGTTSQLLSAWPSPVAILLISDLRIHQSIKFTRFKQVFKLGKCGRREFPPREEWIELDLDFNSQASPELPCPRQSFITPY